MMGTTTAKGLPYPFGFEGNNVPGDLLAIAARIDAILGARTYAEISALTGADLWDGRIVFQTNTGALRPFTGLYAYKATASLWQALLPTSAGTYTPLDLTVVGAPVLGTGPDNSGRWTRFGTQVLASFAIRTGSSGAYTNGTWSVVAPIAYKDAALTAPVGVAAVGIGVFFDSSASTYRIVDLSLGGEATGLVVTASIVGVGVFTSTSPVTVAIGDGLCGFLFYETAEQVA